MTGYRTVSHDEAASIVARGEAVVLDVRTPAEHAELGHIPGSWLLPVDLVVSAPAVLPGGGRPVLVYCEHGVRSAAASGLLAQAGVGEVLNLSGGMAAWSGPREFGPTTVKGPATWLLQNADLLPRGGSVLDVACGRGRHALLMASAGFRVRALDRDPRAIAFLSATAAKLGLSIDCEVRDLETEPPPVLPHADIVLVFNYLHRPLMPRLVEAVLPGGRLFYETFTTAQAGRGGPRNPAFLLDDGELPGLVTPLGIERAREGEAEGKFIASIVAARSAGQGALDGRGSDAEVRRVPLDGAVPEHEQLG